MATLEDDQPLEKIQIPGPTLASLLQLFTSSPGDISGLLLGHVTHLTPAHLSDDTDTIPTAPTIIATITNTLQLSNNDNVLNPSKDDVGIIGWFSGRRRTHLRPSLRESSVTAALSRKHYPCIFLLLTSPPRGNQNPNDLIHTLEYRAYQFLKQSSKFDPKTLAITNIGPSFRQAYSSFSPISPFPFSPCDFRGSSSMAQDHDNDDLNKGILEGMGIDVEKLSRLIGPDAAAYTVGLEEMFEGMLAKLEQLARLVNESDARVSKQLERRHQVPNAINDITSVASDVEQPGEGGERENKKQKELITYQRKRKRTKSTVSIYQPVDSSIELKQTDESELKIEDVQGENVSPCGLGRSGPYSTLPEEDPTPVKGRVEDPESKVNLIGSDLQDQLPDVGDICKGKTELEGNGFPRTPRI